jgi:hypothetical protein
MLDLFAVLVDRRVSRGSGGGEGGKNWHIPYRRLSRRPYVAAVPTPERPPAATSTSEWPDGVPEVLLGLWTELAWRHCHAACGQEGARDPDEYPAYAA